MSRGVKADEMCDYLPGRGAAQGKEVGGKNEII